MSITGLLAFTLLGCVFWMYRVNNAMKCVPQKARDVSRPWSKQETRAAFERVKARPISFVEHLPPKLDRRYIIVGGSGMWCVL